jgi:hypothetical protein
VTARPTSLGDLAGDGAPLLAHYRERERPPASPSEWLGIAVGHLPELAASARTADDLHPHSRIQSVEARTALLDSLTGELALAAATLDAARACLLDRHPDCGGDDAEGYADLIEAGHRSSPRHGERMVAAYAAFTGAAVQAAGSLADCELALARAPRWGRSDPERAAELRAAQLHSALTNALGVLLAWARLADDDAAHLTG